MHDGEGSGKANERSFNFGLKGLFKKISLRIRFLKLIKMIRCLHLKPFESSLLPFVAYKISSMPNCLIVASISARRAALECLN